VSGLTAFPSSSLVNRAAAYLEAGPASSVALVRDVLGGDVLDEAAFAAARFAGAGRRDGSGLLLMLALLIALAELGVATRTR